MVASNFDLVLPRVLAHEGGLVDHPRDPGGRTNKGITQRVFDAFRRRKSSPTRAVDHITDAEAKEIYKRQYWDAIRGDDLPAGVDYAVFDYAVNSGPAQAAKDLQRAISESADGAIGQRTIDATYGKSGQIIIDDLCDRRLAFLRRLKTFGAFGKGWTRRVEGVRKAASSMAIRTTPPRFAGEFDAAPAKADPADTAVSRSAEGRAGAIAGVGAVGSAVTDAANQLAPYQSVTPALQYVFIALTIIGVGIGLYLTYRRFANGAAS
ncbi:lysozyme family protein [Pseudochelatococcus lubricantis]|uniref:Lysozyme family protein n=1 Tax=Pseudochelatococcus lubricantis TaxID=1538102 RepID=A0ABX0UWE1_9HYPH|nr:glycoside hydrolase family 108 protein [Pseudochelatococcus lubricantis]NIJ57263.1 lysozyme family protein [Pseudochelatococcus lubricantis]